MITDEELWERLFDAKCNNRPFEAYAKLAHDTEIQGVMYRADQRMRVTMVSRLGDVGLTTDLGKDLGYQVRIICHPTPKATYGIKESLLKDIEIVRE